MKRPICRVSTNRYVRSFSHSIRGPISVPQRPDSDSFHQQAGLAIFCRHHIHERLPGCTTYVLALDQEAPHARYGTDGPG